jgi:hypothetical protein
MNLRGAENTLAYTSSLPNHNGGVDYEDVDEGEKRNMKSMPRRSTTWAGRQFLTIAIVLMMWAIGVGVVLFSGTSNKTKVAILPKETMSTKKWLRYPQQIKLHIHALFDSSSDSDDSSDDSSSGDSGDSSGDSGDRSGDSGHTSDDSDDSSDDSGSSSNESGSSLDDRGSSSNSSDTGNHRSSTSDANSSSNDSSTDGVKHGSNSNDSDDMETNTYFRPMPHQRYHLGKRFHQEEEEPSHHSKSHNVGVSEHHHSESAVHNKKMHHKHGNEHR